MIEEIKKHAASIQILVILLIIAVSIYLFQIGIQVLSNFSDILIILICAWLLSFVLEPLVIIQQQYLKVSKTIAAVLSYVFVCIIISALIFLFIRVIIPQMQSLLDILPRYIDHSPPYLRHSLNTTMSYLDNIFPLISPVAQILFDIVLIFILSFYFIVDRDRINTEMFNLTPKRWHPHMRFIQQLIDTNFASFIRVQLIFGLLSGIGTWIVLMAFRVEFAPTTAVLSGILTLIPLVGPVLALIPALLLPVLTDTTQAILIFILLLILQQIIFNIIGPRILSKAFKLHPVIILLSFLVGYKIAGGIGAIFAVPVLGILAVLIHQFSKYYFTQKNKENHM